MLRNSVAILIAGLASAVVSGEAAAQEAATAGGDVTADEAAVLPPIVVEAPSKPIAQRKIKAKGTGGGGLSSASGTSGSGAGPSSSGDGAGAVAGPGGDGDGEGEGEPVAGDGSPSIFTLGQLDLVGGSTITNEAMWTYNKGTLDQAVGILPGVTMHSTGGSRNERDIFVRGFDRFRVPLTIDGVRIYLPADNRLDFGRFLTPDLSEIQVQKGYVSVLNGPGGMGGAINLVSRKPTKEIELEGRSGAIFDGDLSSVGQWNSYAFAGTRQRGWYGQVSGNIVDQDHFSLSDDFVPVLLQNEDGGDRDHSEFKDWRINAKLGFTPNATDEYVINYTDQQGEKRAPLHVEGQRVQGPRYWDWPQWDVSSVSWLSKTQIGSASYIKTNAYYNTFESILASYDDDRYTTQTFPGGMMGLVPFTFTSPYRDHAHGGFIEIGTELIPMNTLKAAIHYRRDAHSEGDQLQPDGVNLLEPRQKNIERTLSYAIENTFHLTRNFDLLMGASYNTNEVDRSDGLDSLTNLVVPNELAEADAWDGQGGAIYRYAPEGSVHATVSSRTRFATTFDRYSTRFGTRVVDPNLKPERATNYELGWGDTFFRSVKLSSAVFYSEIEDSIQNVFAGIAGSGSIVGINATGETYGFEFSADWDITPTLRIGGNYTYLEREFDFDRAAEDPFLTPEQAIAVRHAGVEGTPRHEAFIYLAWKATPSLTLTPNLELASDRSSLITSCRSTLVGAAPGCPVPQPLPQVPNYAEIGSYALLNFQAEYRFDEHWTAAIGGTNLLDDDYALAEGFPEPGRQFFANVRGRF